jgi:glyoxylase-like metal-dependent hydrolase (beta-lactamase superfamily II)
VQVEQLRAGLWWWTGRHPEWTEADGGPDGWEADVSSYALVAEDVLVLVDPLVPPEDEERFWQALDEDVRHHGPPRILLTVFWHARSARTIRERYLGAEVRAPSAGEAEARERVALDGTFVAGDRLPGGVEAKGTVPGFEDLFWVPAHGALVAGDVLLGTPDGGIRVCPDAWLPEGVTGSALRDGLAPLLDLPLELLLPTHGEPVRKRARDALAAALTP